MSTPLHTIVKNLTGNPEAYIDERTALHPTIRTKTGFAPRENNKVLFLERVLPHIDSLQHKWIGLFYVTPQDTPLTFYEFQPTGRRAYSEQETYWEDIRQVKRWVPWMQYQPDPDDLVILDASYVHGTPQPTKDVRTVLTFWEELIPFCENYSSISGNSNPSNVPGLINTS